MVSWNDAALSHESVAAPEPTTGFYDSLTVAWDKEQITVVGPGATKSWSLSVHVGTGEELFPTK